MENLLHYGSSDDESASTFAHPATYSSNRAPAASSVSFRAPGPPVTASILSVQHTDVGRLLHLQ